MAKVATAINWKSILGNLAIVFAGSIFGKIAGSALGRISGVGGIGAVGLGFVLLDKMDDKKWLGYFTIGTGAGMIASPILEVAPSEVKGLEGFGAFAEDFKTGAKSSTRNLAAKFFLDKTPLAKYLPNAMSGFGDLEDVSEEQAQKIIDEMIEENRKKQLNGPEDDDISGLMEDYNLNGSLSEDYGISGGSEVDEMGRLKWGNRLKSLSPENQMRVRKAGGKKSRRRGLFGEVGEVEEILEGTDLAADYL